MNPKKKIFIVAGTHGNEIAAPVNTYVLIKNLLNCKSSDALKILASFDIYIVPCLNGYGIYHNQRPNADWVDINRNYPTKFWKESGADTIGNKTGCVYSGPSAGSTFENQLVRKLIEIYKPDIAVDHHSYRAAGTDHCFYEDVGNDEQIKLAYRSLCDCSFAFISDFSEFFGSAYKLLVDSDTPKFAPGLKVDMNIAEFPAWGNSVYGTGVCDDIAICEVPSRIEGITNSGYFDADVFAICEFTLRNYLTHHANFILNR